MTKEENMMKLFEIWADEYTDAKDFDKDEDEFGGEYYTSIQTEKLFNAFAGGWLECDKHRKSTKAIHDEKMRI